MMNTNILNMRGSLNGVWAATMSHQQIVEKILDKFKRDYRFGTDPNDVMIAIIDDMGMADDLSDSDYDYIGEAASAWLRRNYK